MHYRYDERSADGSVQKVQPFHLQGVAVVSIVFTYRVLIHEQALVSGI